MTSASRSHLFSPIPYEIPTKCGCSKGKEVEEGHDKYTGIASRSERSIKTWTAARFRPKYDVIISGVFAEDRASAMRAAAVND